MSHDEHCGCGHNHEHLGHNKDAFAVSSEMTENQKDFLHLLSHHHFLPVACFTIMDSQEQDFITTALAPVFLHSVTDDMKTVKETGTFLRKLEDMGLVTLDYDIPLEGYAYEEYKASALYEFFCTTVAEGASKPNFLGNIPVLELGSIALTELGQQIANAYCAHAHHQQG